MKRFRPHLLVFITLAIVSVSGLHTRLENTLADLRLGWLQREATGNVVVVAIDSKSIEAMGVWPWSRQLHAQLLRQLEKAGVRDVAFDIDFSSQSDEASDLALESALREVGGSTVLPSFKQLMRTNSVGERVFVNRPLKQFREHAWPAVVNVTVEADGLVRRYPLGETIDETFVPSMAALMAGHYAESQPPFAIDFGINPASIPTISFVDVLRGDHETLNALKDKKVIVGATAIELGDRFSTPKGRVVSGPILQSLATESILQNRALRPTSSLTSLAVICLISVLMLFSWRRLNAGMRVLLLVGLTVSVELSALIIQSRFPIIFDTALIEIAIAVYLIAIALDELDFRDLLGRVAERRFQRMAMSLGDGVVCADSNQNITLWNLGASAMFGYDSADVQGKRFDILCGLTNPENGPPFKLSDIETSRHQAPGGVMLELEARRKDGTLFPVEACLSGWNGTDGFHYGVVLRDITLRKREASRIKHLAEHDELTGLSNRHSLTECITAALRDGQPIALVLIGLDKFQHINDMWGHLSGNLILCSIAQRLKTEISEGHFLGRLNGDKFAVVSTQTTVSEVSDLCAQIKRVFERPFSAGVRSHRLNASIGTTTSPTDGSVPDELIGNSHLALRQAKITKNRPYISFQSSFRTELETRLRLEAELADAFAQSQFELFYQPQVRLSDCQLIGAEALIRWRHPIRGLVSPAEFMPIVNASSISDAVANWVLQTACNKARAWEQRGSPVKMGVNLSPSHLLSGDLVHSVNDALARTHFSPSLLELEVTEDILISDENAVLNTFRAIQELGVGIVFDDFGTGYASLSYLKKFPLDGLKIDRSFVSSLGLGSEDRAIVAATIDLSKKLGLSIIAEGIEDQETANLLFQMGCKNGQGYLFGRPMSAQDFEAKFLGAETSFNASPAKRVSA